MSGSSARQRAPAWAEGWPLVGTVTGLTLALSVGIVGAWGFGPEAYGIGARVTLRVGFVCFTAAFIASSLPHYGSNPTFKWILRNRRYLGVSFAVAHFFHFLFVYGLVDSGAAPLNGSWLEEPGLAVYLLLAVMVATSFDVTAKAIPRPVWLGIHRVGMYAAWFAFLGAFGGRSAEGMALYHVFTAVCVVSVLMRWWVTFARWRRRRAA